MYKDTQWADVIDVSSDEDEKPPAVASCRLSGLVNKKSSSPRQYEAAETRIDKGSGQKLANTDRESLLKEDISEQCCLRLGKTEEVHVCSDAISNSTPNRAADTCGVFTRRAGMIEDKKEELDDRITGHVVQEALDTVQNIYLSPSYFPNGSAANLQLKQVSRRFWKAGDYEVRIASSRTPQNGMDHVRVHPKFLHSNATSHKWALGAIAELLDNAIDEVQTGATFVSVDKVENPRDGSPILLVQDNGGGMDPDCIRQCMSLGYSRKTTNTTIGQYGNGFKTSTMRLGADVIVFSRCSGKGYATQSIGLLSYTFLRATGHEDIVVPMVDFEISSTNAGKPQMLVRTTKDDWLNNLSTILQWSPYATEPELLKQFDDIQSHGTKIVVYNLWLNDDGELELDFETDKQDIQLRGAPKLEKADTLQKQLTYQHIANRLRYSLRAYSSVLYLQMPSNFQILLRGQVVQHLSIADDLKFPERILYKPQIGNYRDFGGREVSVITTIGFAKEAPMVNVHGFNVYHKNRLIMPFWKVFHENSSRGKGVVGVLEANFMEPAHDKQDFERTPILQRLETRLKQMTIEYWNLHCELIGYQPPRQPIKARCPSSNTSAGASSFPPVQPCSNQLGAYPQNVMATGIPAALVGAVASYSTPFSAQSRDQIAFESLQFTPFSQGPNGMDEMSSHLLLRSRMAQGNLSPKYAVSCNPDAAVDVKPFFSGTNGAELNQLQPNFPSAVRLDTRTDGKQDETFQGRASSSATDINFNSSARNHSASAPSTPPQPGSDIGMLCKQLDVASGERSDDQRAGKFPWSGYAEDTMHLQGGISGRDKTQLQETLVANNKIEAQDAVLVKRSVAEAHLTDLERASKLQRLPAAIQMIRIEASGVSDFQKLEGMAMDGIISGQKSVTTVNVAEILEEVKELRLRCIQYECEKKQLESKVSQLEQKLVESQSKYNMLDQQHELVKPKEEC